MLQEFEPRFTYAGSAWTTPSWWAITPSAVDELPMQASSERLTNWGSATQGYNYRHPMPTAGLDVNSSLEGGGGSGVEIVCDGLDHFGVTWTVILVILIGLVAAVTIAGNTLVVIAFGTDRKLRSFGNYFIINLAISDLIVGLLICVYAPVLLRGCWQLTRAGCLVWLLLDYVVPLASAWNMALISLDRYWSVARPIEYRVAMSTRRAVVFMAVPWLVGLVWYGPSVLLWTVVAGGGQSVVPRGECYVEFYDNVGYLLASSFVEFVAPFVTVATINILIYLNIRQRSRGLTSNTAAPCATKAAVDTTSPPSGECSGGGGGHENGHVSRTAGVAAVSTTTCLMDDQQKRLKARRMLTRDKKSARSLTILVVVFLVTWAPFEICAFVNPVCQFCISKTPSEIVFWLLWLNSTINPILYPFLQQRFRIAFIRILRSAFRGLFCGRRCIDFGGSGISEGTTTTIGFGRLALNGLGGQNRGTMATTAVTARGPCIDDDDGTTTRLAAPVNNVPHSASC